MALDVLTDFLRADRVRKSGSAATKFWTSIRSTTKFRRVNVFKRQIPEPSRRGFLLASAGALVAAQQALANPLSDHSGPHHSAGNPGTNLKPEDRRFLEDYQKRCFRYFWEQWNNRTGLF